MASDTVFPWSEYFGAIGSGVATTLVAALVLALTPIGTSVTEVLAALIGAVVAVGYVIFVNIKR